MLTLLLATLPLLASPSDEEEVRVAGPADDVVLAGTLSLPAGKGRHPAVLLLTGSGGHTRDQVISGLPMFQVLAEHLVERGFAVLRVDDRGEGQSTGSSVRASTTADRVGDATACFRYLAQRPEIDASRVGLLGHSEGTLTAAMMAASMAEVRLLVLLSPFAIRGAELWVWQQAEILRREGELDAQKIASIETALTGLVRHIGLEGNGDEGFYAHGRAACLAWGDPPEDITDAFVTEAFGDLRQTWYEYFFATNPRSSLEKVKQPLLALLGSEDQQTPPHLNVPPLVEALTSAGNDAFSVAVLPGEDHFFMKAEGRAPNEHVYGEMELSSEALATIGDWLVRQTLVDDSLAAPQAPAQEPAAHPREYWQAIAENRYALPEGESAYELIVDLSRHLGSRDSQLRDDLAYGIPAAWIHRQQLLDPFELLALQELWSANLEHGIGRKGDDSVLLRSFSALNLALLAAYDNGKRFMEQEHFDALLGAALGYLERERDLRGWSEEAGWYHSAAHTADLLKFLGRSRFLSAEGQHMILAGIANRLANTGGEVFVHGEDERLAAAVVAIMDREDLESEAFEEFLRELAGAARRTQSAAAFDPVLFAAQQNCKNLLRALYVSLAGTEQLPAELDRLRRLVLTTLGTM